MNTITEDNYPELPNPPISAADVDIEQEYEVPIDDSFTYSLHSYRKTAERFAEKRNGSKPTEGDLFGDRTATQAHKIGYLGELVVAMRLNLTFSMNISKDGDKGWDHTFYSDILSDLTIDTKTTATQINQPKLVVSAEDTPPADFFVLVHLRRDNEIARIIGFRDRLSIVSREPKMWPGQSLNYVLGWDELYPPRFFYPLVRNQAVLRSRDSGEGLYCQNCGQLLFRDVEHRIYFDSLEHEIGLCYECATLLEAAERVGNLKGFTLYERPVLTSD